MLDFIREVAREAGELVISERQTVQGAQAQFKAGEEMVTRADRRVDALISERIRARFPAHRVLAEESAPDTAGLSQEQRPLWIVDPIDGTVNYAHGHYQVAVSIAYAEKGRILAAVVHNPFLDEMFHAEAGGGAFLNDGPIHVGGQENLRRSLVATGFPYRKDNMAPFLRRVSLVLERCADVRRLGSAALDICWVAAGRIDAYYESLSVWDFAAAQLIAIEAGARYGHFQPVPDGVSPVFHNENILVANPLLYPKMEALLREADQGERSSF